MDGGPCVCVYIPDLCSFLPVFFCFIVFLTRLHVPDTVVASGIGYMSSFVTCSRHVRDRCDAMVMQKCIHARVRDVGRYGDQS